MIIREFYAERSDGVKLYRTYSDAGKRILQVETQTVYDDAIDVENSKYTYVETEEDVPNETDNTEEDPTGE